LRVDGVAEAAEAEGGVRVVVLRGEKMLRMGHGGFDVDGGFEGGEAAEVSSGGGSGGLGEGFGEGRDAGEDLWPCSGGLVVGGDVEMLL
jgi:hypothetical protein